VWCPVDLSYLCPNSEIPGIPGMLLVGSHGATSDDSTCCGSLVVYLVDWLFTLISWLILTVWFLVIDWWSCCQRPAAGSRGARGTPVFRSAAEMWHILFPSPKFTAESKVRWSSVIPFCTRHSRSASKVSTLLFSNLGLQTIFFSKLGLQTLFLSNRSWHRRYFANSPRIW